MGPNEQIFKKEYALELFRIAQNDLVTAKSLAPILEARRETVLLHCHQAVEKSLKAVLCHERKPVPFTHELTQQDIEGAILLGQQVLDWCTTRLSK